MIKQRKGAGICRNKKEKSIREKNNCKLEEINQKVLAKEGRLKRYRQRVKQQTKQDIPKKKKRKENSLNNWEDTAQKHTTTGCKRNRTILEKNMATKKHNRKAE